MSNTTVRIGKKAYSDNKNFRNGIRRSGHFSISESYLLEKYGQTLVLLSTGNLPPENEEEQRFTKVCKGEYAAESQLEKLWLKYIEKTSPQKFHTLFGNRKAQTSGSLPGETIVNVEE